MTIYSQPPRTMAIEKHNGFDCICVVENGKSIPLAHFLNANAVDVFKDLQRMNAMYMHAMGASGL